MSEHRWTLQGVVVSDATIEKIVDGDTLNIWIPVCCKRYVFPCRLRGIDTPEIRTKDMEEKASGLRAKQFVEQSLQDASIEVHCFEFDKYGRVLCDVYFTQKEEKQCLNQVLLQEGLAKPYPMKK